MDPKKRTGPWYMFNPSSEAESSTSATPTPIFLPEHFCLHQATAAAATSYPQSWLRPVVCRYPKRARGSRRLPRRPLEEGVVCRASWLDDPQTNMFWYVTVINVVCCNLSLITSNVIFKLSWRMLRGYRSSFSLRYSSSSQSSRNQKQWWLTVLVRQSIQWFSIFMSFPTTLCSRLFRISG